MERTLNFTVTGQHIESTNSIEDIVANTSGYLKAKFTLDEIYTNLMAAAVFTSQGKSYALVLDANNEVEIPREVLTGEKFSVGVYGAAGEGVITTDTVDIPLDKSVRVRFSLNKSYLDLYVQLNQEFEDFVNGANGILKEHIALSVQQEAGTHDLRVIDGIFQYYNHVLEEWVDASTGSLSGIIANNLTTSSPGKVLDAYQGFYLYQMLKEHIDKYKEEGGVFKYFYQGKMIPVAKEEELTKLEEEIKDISMGIGNLPTIKVYKEYEIAAGRSAQITEGITGRFLIYKSESGTIALYFINTGATGILQHIAGVTPTIEATTIPAMGFTLSNNTSKTCKIRVCNTPYIEGM